MSETETSHEDRTKTRPPANPRREALMAALFMLLLLLPVWWITGEHVRGNLLATAQGQALAELSPHSNALGGALGERLTLLKALHTFALVGTGDEEFLEDHFTRFVSGLYSTTEKVCDLVIAPGGVAHYVYPPDSEAIPPDHNLLREGEPGIQADIQRAIESGEVVISAPYELDNGNLGLMMWRAVYDEDGNFWGLAVLAVDFSALLEEAGLDEEIGGLRIALRNGDGELLFGENAVFEAGPVISPVYLPDERWELGAVPVNGWEASIAEQLILFQLMTFSIVGLLTILSYLIVNRQAWLTQAVEERTGDLSQANERLRAEVTVRKRIEQALRESEEKFRNLIEQSLDGIVLVDEQGTIIEWNRGQEQITGIPQAEALGKPIWEMQARISPRREAEPQIQERLEKEIRSFFQTGTAPWLEKVLENDILCPDGTRRTVQSVTFPIKISRGLMLGSVSRDITGRKQAEEARERALWQIERLYTISQALIAARSPQELLEVSAEPLMAKGPSLATLLYADDPENPEWVEVIAHVRAGEELTPLVAPGSRFPVSDLVSDPTLLYEHPNQINLLLDPGMEDSPMSERVHRLVEASGGQSLAVIPLRTLSKRWVGFIALAWANPPELSETDRQLYRVVAPQMATLLENQLLLVRTSTQAYFLHSLLNGLPIGVLATDAEGTIIEINPAYERMTGFSRDEMRGRNALEMGAPDQQAQDATLIRKALERGETLIHYESELVRKDGTTFPAAIYLAPMRNDEGEVTGFLASLEDITERKEAEAALRKRTEELSLLYEAGKQLSRTLDQDAIYDTLYDLVSRVMACDNMVVSSYDPADRMIYCCYVCAEGRRLDADKFPPIPLEPEGQGVQSVVIRDGKPRLIRDYQKRARQARHYYYGDAEKVITAEELPEDARVTQSALIVPLKLEEQVIGVLQVQSYRPDSYTEDDLKFLEALSSQVAAASMNATLYQQAQREITERERATEAEREQRRLAEALSDIAAVLNRTLDLEVVLEHILAELGRVVPHDAANIMLIEEGGTVRGAQARGYSRHGVSEWILSRRFTVEEIPPLREMMETGQPVIVSDTHADPRWITFPETSWIRSYLATPIKVGNEVIGFLQLDSLTPGAFTDAHAKRLQAFADQAAIAINNARLYEAIRERAARLELIARIGQQTTAILQPDELLHRAVRLISEMLNCTSIEVFMVEGDEVVLRASTHPVLKEYEGTLCLRAGEEGIIGWVAGSGKPLLVPDVSQEPRYYACDDVPETRSEAAVPIRLKGIVIGVLDAQSDRLNDFSREDLFTLQTVADQLAVALESAHLYEAAQRRAAELEALYRVTLSISAELDVDTVLQAIIESAMELLNAGGGGIYLYHPERDELEWAISIGPGMVPVGTVLRRGEGLSGRILETGEPLIVEQYAGWEGRPAALDSLDFDAILGVPVRWGDELLGIINVTHAVGTGRTFSEQDKRLLSLFAAQAAIAIRNARLYQESETRNRRLALLNEITRIGTATLDLDELVRTLADKAAAIIGGDGCYITRWDPDTEEVIPVAASGDLHESYISQEPSPPDDATLTAASLRLGRPLAVDDVFNTPYLSRHIAERYPARSALALPLQADGRDLGALLITFNRPHHFVEDEIAWARQAAELIALAIAKAQAYAELERRVEERTAELKAANERLIELSQLKDEFVANVSHELRTPVASIKLYHHLLAAWPEKQETYMEHLRRETERLEYIIEDLLYLSRLDQNQARATPETVDLNTLVRLSVEDRALLAEERELELTFSADPHLPVIPADPRLIERAFDAILTNALNFTPPGGRIAVSTQRRQAGGREWATFSVSDTGPGIPADEIEHVFERFFRGEVGQRAGVPGTGLGLSIVKEIVERHGGRIEVESRGIAGEGTTFTVWLPVDNPEGGE